METRKRKGRESARGSRESSQQFGIGVAQSKTLKRRKVPSEYVNVCVLLRPENLTSVPFLKPNQPASVVEKIRQISSLLASATALLVVGLVDYLGMKLTRSLSHGPSVKAWQKNQ